MELALFWIFSALMLVFGLMVVFMRSPVSSALSLVVSFLGLSALFFSLDAYFIGIIQILVYAGAVMVLFLFIIMLFDLRAESVRKLNVVAITGGAFVVFSFMGLLTKVVFAGDGLDFKRPAMANPGWSDVAQVGQTLFSVFNLPFQIIGVLLLVATVGVVLLSKKELK